jgi:hypothetical protein
MDEEINEFFDLALSTTVPCLTHDERKAVVDKIIARTFVHPRADGFSPASAVSNIARELGLEDHVPFGYRDEGLKEAYGDFD